MESPWVAPSVRTDVCMENMKNHVTYGNHQLSFFLPIPPGPNQLTYQLTKQ